MDVLDFAGLDSPNYGSSTQIASSFDAIFSLFDDCVNWSSYAQPKTGAAKSPLKVPPQPQTPVVKPPAGIGKGNDKLKLLRKEHIDATRIRCCTACNHLERNDSRNMARHIRRNHRNDLSAKSVFVSHEEAMKINPTRFKKIIAIATIE